jgi:flavin reductase (DIM6/NTAB) family NADH-FMN oxidoreductase RutF
MYATEELTPLTFRQTCAQFPTGVTIITASTRDDAPRGMTLSAFMSVSIDPYLVAISVANGTHLARTLARTDRYAVSFLQQNQRDVSSFFAGRKDALAAAPFHYPVEDAPPVVEGALAWMQCKIAHSVSAGDHTLWFGAPDAIWCADLTSGRQPLVFAQSAYQTLNRDSMVPVDWPVDYLAVARLP